MDSSFSTSFQTGRSILSDCKHILYVIVQFCNKEALEERILVLVSQSIYSASEITGVLESSIKRIRKVS